MITLLSELYQLLYYVAIELARDKPTIADNALALESPRIRPEETEEMEINLKTIERGFEFCTAIDLNCTPCHYANPPG
jgi:hypothetical protein